jgi:hypothetical protein
LPHCGFKVDRSPSRLLKNSFRLSQVNLGR